MKHPKDNPFKDLLVVLLDHEVDFIVAGGVAAILHGVPRVTLDLDISISMEEKNIRRFLSAMKKLNLVPRVPVPPETLLLPEAREKIVRDKGAVVFTFIDHKDPLRHVDVFLTRELSFNELVKHVVVEKLDNHAVKIVSAEYLLKLKKAIDPPRPKDVLDIQILAEILEQRNDSGKRSKK